MEMENLIILTFDRKNKRMITRGVSFTGNQCFNQFEMIHRWKTFLIICFMIYLSCNCEVEIGIFNPDSEIIVKEKIELDSSSILEDTTKIDRKEDVKIDRNESDTKEEHGILSEEEEDDDDDNGEDSEEDEAMKEIKEMQKREAEEQALLTEAEKLDDAAVREAMEADQRAKEEAATQAAASAEGKSASATKSKATSSSSTGSSLNDLTDWSRRSRPGAMKQQSSGPSIIGKSREQGRQGMGMGIGSNGDSGSNKGKGGLDSLVSPEIRAQATLANNKQRKGDMVVQARQARCKIPRIYARPVEQTISAYLNPSTDLYSVLGVSRYADSNDLKISYRNSALNIHPDKNPHPDAKRAFEYVQEAFTTLSSPIKRNQYDNRIRKKGKVTMKKIFRKIYDFYNNSKSQFLLSMVRIRNGEMKQEFEELLQINERKATAFFLAEKFVLQPSGTDRYQLLGEVYFDNFKKIVKYSLLVRILLLPFF